ncbi:MAG: hypothetical protein IBJ03_02830 [Gemmatimonadaceae bacterium]|nr:hypothetical protein [Gemmatimonadaceae bacterium]
MYYLYEHQLGYHSLALGFPSIDGCNAICLQTKTGLFGIHVYGCDAFNHIGRAMEKESTAFGEFVRTHTQGQEFVHMYSTCFHKKRGWSPGGKDAWKRELKFYADAIGFKGPCSGFDLSSIPNWPGGIGSSTSDSAYVEYRRVFDDVSILYKPWGQCVHPTEIKASSIADGVNYRSTNQKGEVSDKFWFDKALKSLSTNGTGFVLSAKQLRLHFKHK